VNPAFIRTIPINGIRAIEAIERLLPNLPLDANLECVIRPEQKVRKLSQNAAMWAGPLTDIAKQAWVSGRQHSAKVWHEYFNEQFLPETFDPELCKDGYRKWDFDPAGARRCVGSTTELTRKGFSLYLLEVEAFGANLGVLYSATPDQIRRAA
jgi:hypothetical protein